MKSYKEHEREALKLQQSTKPRETIVDVTADDLDRLWYTPITITEPTYGLRDPHWKVVIDRINTYQLRIYRINFKYLKKDVDPAKNFPNEEELYPDMVDMWPAVPTRFKIRADGSYRRYELSVALLMKECSVDELYSFDSLPTPGKYRRLEINKPQENNIVHAALFAVGGGLGYQFAVNSVVMFGESSIQVPTTLFKDIPLEILVVRYVNTGRHSSKNICYCVSDDWFSALKKNMGNLKNIMAI